MIQCPVDGCQKTLRDKRGLHSHLRVHNLNGAEITAMADKVESNSSDSKYPDDWSKRRSKVLRRDGYECQECGSTNRETLDVHHKIPLSEGGTNELSNLTTLCRDCHSKKHPNNPLLGNKDRKESIHHDFRKQLCEEYGIDYETAKKYDYLHDKIISKRIKSLF